MQKIHFYFFCLYNFIYRDGLEMQRYAKATGRAKILPERRTILGLFFSTWLWTIVVRLLVIDLFKPNFKLLSWGFLYEMIFAAIIYGIYFFYFVQNSRFADIYVQYRSTDQILQRRGARKVFWFLILPLILLPLMIWISVKYLHIDLTRH